MSTIRLAGFFEAEYERKDGQAQLQKLISTTKLKAFLII